MEKKITIQLEISETTGRKIRVTPSELGLTEKEWAKLTEDEKMDAIKKYVDDLPEQPYWYAESFSE